jgi:hypothetical protein
VNPLPPKPLSSEVQDFNRVLSDKFPKLFGPKADHHCQYREHLFQLVAADLQQSSTQKVAGAFCHFVQLAFNLFHISLALLSSKKCQTTLDFVHLQSTLAADAGAGPSNRSGKTASTASPIPHLVARTVAASLPIVEDDSSPVIQRSLQPNPSLASGSRAVPTPPPLHIEVIFLSLFFQ